MTRYSLNERIQCYCAEGECYYNILFVCVCMCVFVCCGVGGAYLCVHVCLESQMSKSLFYAFSGFNYRL